MAKESYAGYDDFVDSKKSKTTVRANFFYLTVEYSLDLVLADKCNSIRILKVVPFVRRQLKMAKAPKNSATYKRTPLYYSSYFLIFFSFSILVVALLGGNDDILNMLQTLMKIQIFFCGVTPAETLFCLTFSCVFKFLFVLIMYSVSFLYFL